MSPAQSQTATSSGMQASRAPRCRHTSLTKPECHCPACLSEQMAAHRPGAAVGAGADLGRVAA
jgi:hypothetical protein